MANFTKFLMFAKILGLAYSLPYCNETINNENESIQLCKLSETYCPICPPKDWPRKITPVIDFKDVLEVDEQKKSITILISFIMIWNDPTLNHTG